MKIEDLKNIQALLLKGKWELTAQESAILVNLVNTVGEEIKKLETPEPVIYKTTTSEIKGE